MKYSPILDQVNTVTLSEVQAANPALVVAGAEKAYHEKILAVCDSIVAQNRQMILVTGPSASGKTTSSQKIAEELRGRGKKVISVSLDNFYKDAEELPKWKDGYQNYESIEGLDLDSFDRSVSALLRDGRAEFPLFDFTSNTRSRQSLNLTFDEQTFLIFEGIHALNPEISHVVEHFANVKIYISVHSEFTDGNGKVLLTARDLRLMRRILRDFTYRGTAAEETFEMWDYVLMGEDLYIRPFRKNADIHIDSTHAYEPFLYHDDVIAALQATNPASSYRKTVERLWTAAEHFFSMDKALVPASSLLQEFIKP